MRVLPLTIGKVKLKNNILLAPIAGYTNCAFRKICLEEGAGLTVTEMVSVKGLLHNNEKTIQLLQKSDIEKPCCLQLFGCNPEDFERALDIKAVRDFDIIDINMGCPMPKVTKTGAGSALLKSPAAAEAIVKTLVKNGATVSVKTRIGIENGDNAVDFCKRLEEAGASALVLHGRTQKQLYSGKADWHIIAKVAKALKIPVIGNGDITSAEIALSRLRNYPVSGIMVARGALENPGIFFNIISLDNLERQPFDGAASRAGEQGSQLKTDIILRHIEYEQQYTGEAYLLTKLKKHFAYYCRGFHGAKELKLKLMQAENISTVKQLLLL